jgi:hypothetical protein
MRRTYELTVRITVVAPDDDPARARACKLQDWLCKSLAPHTPSLERVTDIVIPEECKVSNLI